MLPISLALSPDWLAGPMHVIAAGVLIYRWELILALLAAWAMLQLGTRWVGEDGLTLIPPRLSMHVAHGSGLKPAYWP